MAAIWNKVASCVSKMGLARSHGSIPICILQGMPAEPTKQQHAIKHYARILAGSMGLHGAAEGKAQYMTKSSRVATSLSELKTLQSAWAVRTLLRHDKELRFEAECTHTICTHTGRRHGWQWFGRGRPRMTQHIKGCKGTGKTVTLRLSNCTKHRSRHGQYKHSCDMTYSCKVAN